MAAKQTDAAGRAPPPRDPADVEGGIGRTEAPIKDRAGIDRGGAGSRPEHGRAATVDEDYLGNVEHGDDVFAGDR